MNVLSISGGQVQPMCIFAQRSGDERAISRHRRQTQVATSHSVDVVYLDESRRARRTSVMSSGGMSSTETLSGLLASSEVRNVSGELIACDGMRHHVPGIVVGVKGGEGTCVFGDVAVLHEARAKPRVIPAELRTRKRGFLQVQCELPGPQAALERHGMDDEALISLNCDRLRRQSVKSEQQPSALSCIMHYHKASQDDAQSTRYIYQARSNSNFKSWFGQCENNKSPILPLPDQT